MSASDYSYQMYSRLYNVKKFEGDLNALKKIEERPIFIKTNVTEQEQKSKRIFRLAASLQPSQFSLYYVEVKDESKGFNLSPKSEPIFMLIYFGPSGVIRVYDKPISEYEKKFIIKRIAELSGLTVNFSPSPTESQSSINQINLTGSNSTNESNPINKGKRKLNEINLTGNNSNNESSPIIITKKQRFQPKERPYFIEPSMNLKRLLKNKFYYTNVNFNKRDYYISTVYDGNSNKHYVNSILSGDGYRSMLDMYTRTGKQIQLNNLKKSWKYIQHSDLKSKLRISESNGAIRNTTWSNEIHNFLVNYKKNPNKYKSEGKSIDL